MKISLKLYPIIDIDALISIGFEHFDLSIEIDNKSNMIILAISHESLNGALGISGWHEKNVTCLCNI